MASGAGAQNEGATDPAGPPATELVRRYRAAVEALAHQQRDVFRRHRIGGQSIAGIAAALGIDSIVVEQELASALIAISEALDRSD